MTDQVPEGPDPLFPPAAVSLFDSAFNATNDGVLVVDLLGRVVFHNEPAMKMWRFAAPLVVGREGDAGLAAVLQQVQDPDLFLADVRRLAADPEAVTDTLVPLTDGRSFEVRSQPQRLSGAVIGRVWWFRDVTDRQRMVEALRQSEDRFSHLFLASPFSILLATYPEGRIVDVNPAFCRLFERERDEVLGRTTTEIKLWADGADRQRMVAHLRAGQPVQGMEFTFATPDGAPRVVLLSIELVQLRGQWHVLASSVDVTERRRVEDVVRRQSVLLEAIMDGTLDAIFIKDRDGRYQLVNPAGARFIGRPVSEVVGRTDAELFPPETAAEFRLGDCEVMASGLGQLREAAARIGDKAYTFLAQKAPWHDPEGNIIGIVGISRDVTTQRQLEEGLRQAQKIEALGTLAGGIAHDFNNILAAIVGHAEYLGTQLGGQAELGDEVAGILGASRRAKALVRQILTFSRQQPEERKLIALAPVVEEALALLRATVPATITIEVDLADSDAMILADSTQVHQVIVNLGTNAVHAMQPGGGALRSEQRTIESTGPDAVPIPGALPPGRYLRLAVTDSGRGMTPETLRRVFDPFFTTKRPAEGTGLGLAVVHGIMQSHDGAITIESDAGSGTTAWLYFPQVFGPTPLQPGELVAPPRGHGETIMLVDDEPALVRLGTRLLIGLGYRAQGYTSPEAALTAFMAAPEAIDLVFSDLMMPGMTGSELARQMLARRPDLKVVIASGYAGALGTEELSNLGIRELVSKPFDRYVIGETIARCLRSRPSLS